MILQYVPAGYNAASFFLMHSARMRVPAADRGVQSILMNCVLMTLRQFTEVLAHERLIEQLMIRSAAAAFSRPVFRCMRAAKLPPSSRSSALRSSITRLMDHNYHHSRQPHVCFSNSSCCVRGENAAHVCASGEKVIILEQELQ
jgi:hypothetical protein